jgi:hypothetical protein
MFLSFHSIVWDKQHWYFTALEAEIKTQKEVNKSWVVCWNRKQDKSTFTIILLFICMLDMCNMQNCNILLPHES